MTPPYIYHTVPVIVASVTVPKRVPSNGCEALPQSVTPLPLTIVKHGPGEVEVDDRIDVDDGEREWDNHLKLIESYEVEPRRNTELFGFYTESNFNLTFNLVQIQITFELQRNRTYQELFEVRCCSLQHPRQNIKHSSDMHQMYTKEEAPVDYTECTGKQHDKQPPVVPANDWI